MHDRLFESRGALGRDDLVGYARELGLEADRVGEELDRAAHASRVQRDVDSGRRSGVRGTPAFFTNGRRHDGAFDAASLIAALEASAS
jgi:protein-disulfide isomerase